MAKRKRQSQPDPGWVPLYLKTLAQGKTHEYADGMAGVSSDTTMRWRKKSADNLERYTRARAEGRNKARQFLFDAGMQNAKNGSTWFWARMLALFAPEDWKRINDKLRKAEPDMQSKHVTGGETQVTVIDRIKRYKEMLGDDSPDDKADTNG